MVKNRVVARRAMASALAIGIATGSAFAQEAAPPAEDQEVIVVTGSRIQRDPNEVAPSPITSISMDDVRATGQVDVTEALREIPALISSGTISDSIERGEGGIGQAVLNLRGLGSNRTLVVVNGRRHVSGVAGSQAVDVSTIPNALIQDVQVLTGGASAVYGADAVTGVINYVLKSDFDGFDLTAQSGISDQGDGYTGSIEAVAGFNFADGRGNITLSGGYARIDEIQMGARSYTANNGRYNSGLTYQNPARRFQQGDISASATPNFFDYYSLDAGRFPYGSAIPTLAQFQSRFPGLTPSAAEQALIDRALNSPSLAFQAFPAFAISSASGLIYRGDFDYFTTDLDGNGVADCDQSFIGFNYAACYVSTPDGGVRPFRDGIIATGSNQFGGDGAAERASAQSLIPRNDRYTFNMLTKYEFSDAVELFAEGKYVRTETASQNPYNTFYDTLYISPDNPYIPAAIRGEAVDSGGLYVSRDFFDLGPNYTMSKRDTYRAVVGARGQIAEGLRYEISGVYGRTNSQITRSNNVLYDRLFAALDAVDEGQFLSGIANGNIRCRSDLDPTARHPGSEAFPVIAPGFFTFNPGDGQCAPISLFNGVNSVSAAGVNFITTPTTNRSRIEQMVFSGFLTGDTAGFLNLPGGPLQFVAGAEYREEKSRSRFDPLTLGILPIDTPDGAAGDFIGDISPNQSLVFDASTRTYNSGGRYDVWELYGELRVPILAGQRFAETLELSGAARYSKYSNVGGAFTWNVSGIYAPIRDLRLRGTYARAIRAPNIAELFDPDQGTVFRPVDPCDANQIAALQAAGDPNVSNRIANCAADGLPADYTDPLSARFPGTTGGNPNLREEKATTYTFGAVVQPRFIPGLSLSADYYNIKIDDAIDSVTAQDIVDGCYDASSFPNDYCDLFDRNRNASSPTYLGLSFLRQRQLNFGRIETAGIDASISYSFALGDNKFSLRANGNWTEKVDFFFDPGDPSAVDPELGEQGYPEWAGSGSVNWTKGPFTLGYRLQYIGKQAYAGVEIETADVFAGPGGFSKAMYVHDVSFNLAVNDRFTLYGGINNVSNERPYVTNSAYPVSPYGRYYFLGINLTMPSF